MRRKAPERVIRDVGRRVAELRVQRGVTQAEFAEKAKMTSGHVQKIELGQLNLTIQTLVRLANSLNVAIGDLFVAPRSRHVKLGRPRHPRSAQDAS